MPVHRGRRQFGPARRRWAEGPQVSFLQDMDQESELRTVPSWKAHKMTGDRKGTWSLFVTKNWRITFQIDQAEIEIIDLDFEDYH